MCRRFDSVSRHFVVKRVQFSGKTTAFQAVVASSILVTRFIWKQISKHLAWARSSDGQSARLISVRSVVRFHSCPLYGPLVKGLRHRLFTAVTRVRIPYGLFYPPQLSWQQRMTVNHDVVGSSPTGGVYFLSQTLSSFFCYLLTVVDDEKLISRCVFSTTLFELKV